MVAILSKVLRYLRLHGDLALIMTFNLYLFAMLSSADVHGKGCGWCGSVIFLQVVATRSIL
jgi:hypothetical protein